MVKKYEITNESKELGNVNYNVYRIKALKDFNDVKAGDLGGWIAKEDNLSQDGNCWVYDDAVVVDNAIVNDDATVRNRAIICGKAIISGSANIGNNAIVSHKAEVSENASVLNDVQISDCAQIKGKALIIDKAEIKQFAMIYGNVCIGGYTKIYGYAHVYGKTQIFGDINIYENAEIHLKTPDTIYGWNLNIGKDAYITSITDVYVLRKIRHREVTTSFYRNKEGKIIINTSEFTGTFGEYDKWLDNYYDPKEKVKILWLCDAVISEMKSIEEK